ncbi:MAG: TRAP transporter permease [Desulfobacterales bacterium]|nr:TRAP transporter permease [Desulfobacterales bacterium]
MEKSDLSSATRLLTRVETGPRSPRNRVAAGIVTGLCLVWSLFQLFYAQSPFGFQLRSGSFLPFGINFSLDSFRARSWHLAFALALVYLTYPAFKPHAPGFWVRWFRKILPASTPKPAAGHHIPFYDWILAASGASLSLYIWWNYDDIILRGGLPETYEIWLGLALVAVLLEAARRCIGPALPVIAAVFLFYNVAGSYLPGFLRHSAGNLTLIISSQFVSTDGVFGVPLKVSCEFVFLFVLFGAFLEKAGAGKYFIDIAYSLTGRFRGGPAKAAVVASGLNGMISGSSIANTVTTGTFTIPLMIKVGLPDYKAAAIEVAASTNGQLMPPIMGAAAFIMAETLGIPYIDVVRAAFIPAVVSYIALVFVVHIEAMKLGLKRVPASELVPFFSTFFKGIHYLLPVFVLLVYLIVLRRSALASCMLALETVIVLMALQRPVLAWIRFGAARRRPGVADADVIAALKSAALEGLKDIWQSLITGARNMISVGIATATAGIIVGVVVSTGLSGRFINVIDTLSMGNIYAVLILTALTGMFLGMGLPTTANYIMMASLTAPVIVKLGADAGLVFPALAAHLFVFYFGILADDTPPVGLAAYAAAAIAGSDPIKTGVQGFIYDLRTAILPFVFLLNIELLMMGGVDANGAPIWIDSGFKVLWVFFVSILAMFSFAAALQGYFADHCSWAERILLMVLCLALFRPALATGWVPLGRTGVQITAAAVYMTLFWAQRVRRSRRPDTAG